MSRQDGDHDPRPEENARESPRVAVGAPVVALVGRPNVGKSSLFNRLAKKSIAIVHDEPGVTRDRHYADAWAHGRPYFLVDTGGFDPESDDPMRQRIIGQVKLAISEADVVVCLLDATTGATAADREAVGLLRRSDRPIIYAANKADTAAVAHESAELYRLGVEHIFPVSALHGRGIGELEAAIVKAMPPVDPEPPPVAENVARVAVVGRPNAGKSSLVNRLLGTDRMLVDDRPGTTRDAIDAVVTRDGKKIVIVDTAGIRRKSRVANEENPIEGASVIQAIRAIERCDVVVLVCDAAAGVSEQDAKILGLAVDRARGVVIALNKIDLIEGRIGKKLEETARDKLSFVAWAPMVPISARTGRGTSKLWETVQRVHSELGKRISTGELNRFFERALATRPPPTQGGRAPRLFYITQAEAKPPLFVVMANDPEYLHFSYTRFLTNQIRKEFGFEGVPVRVAYKNRRRRER